MVSHIKKGGEIGATIRPHQVENRCDGDVQLARWTLCRWMLLALLSLLSTLPPALADPLPHLSDLEEDPQSQYLAIVSGELTEGRTRDLALPLEPGMLRLEYVLHFNGSVRMTVMDPLGRTLDPAAPFITRHEAAGRRSLQLWDPRPGTWRVQLEGEGAYTFALLAQGEVYFCCGYLVTPQGMQPLARSSWKKGSSHRIQLYVSGFQIDRLELTLIDEAGERIASLPFRQADLSNLSALLALLKVPDRPFRILATGSDLAGRPFQRVLFPLMRPGEADAAPEVAFQRDALLRELADTVRSGEQPLVRAQLLSWSDQPLRLEGGAEIGIRLRFTVRFPLTGIYNPLPQLYPERQAYGATGALSMRLHRLVVTPLPTGLSPLQSSSASDVPPLLAGRYPYTAGTDYHFEAELLPSYVIPHTSSSGFCFQYRIYHQSGVRERFERELARERKSRYRFTVTGSTLEARQPAVTEYVYDPTRWHASYLRLGTAACP